MYAFVVLVFFIPSQEIGLGNISEMTYFVSSGTWNHSSLNTAVMMWWMGLCHSPSTARNRRHPLPPISLQVETSC